MKIRFLFAALDTSGPYEAGVHSVLEVNGNHDIWVCGSPYCGDSNDNFGIGQMQCLGGKQQGF